MALKSVPTNFNNLLININGDALPNNLCQYCTINALSQCFLFSTVCRIEYKQFRF